MGQLIQGEAGKVLSSIPIEINALLETSRNQAVRDGMYGTAARYQDDIDTIQRHLNENGMAVIVITKD